MIRPASALLVVAVAVAAASSLAVPASPALAQRDILACMERCLRAEGRDQKDTCRLRCADVPSATGPATRAPGGHDCMGRHKACQKECGRDRECHRACKAELMNCK